MSADERRRRGLLFVISSPSGAGKTSLGKRLLANHPDIMLSVSATTRTPRPGEKDGVDYYFLEEEEFKRRAREGYFYEWAKVHGYRYGTPKEPVLHTLDEGRDVLLDIDWQGAQQLGQKAEKDLVRVFVLPPSRSELERRLKERAQDSAEVVARRMKEANNEISRYSDYDYVLINDDVDKALSQLHAILAAERVKRQRQTGLVEFVRHLIEAERGDKP